MKTARKDSFCRLLKEPAVGYGKTIFPATHQQEHLSNGRRLTQTQDLRASRERISTAPAPHQFLDWTAQPTLA